MRSVELRLTEGEMFMAGHAALARRISNAINARKPAYGASDEWHMDFIGCMGEVATARHLNLFWSGTVDEFKRKDVGDLVEVRAITDASHSLLLHPKDGDAVPFVLALVQLPRVVLLGWAFAVAGKEQRYWRELRRGRPCYAAPQSILRPMRGLHRWVAERRFNKSESEGEGR
jgi:hypothetical protein